MAFRLARVCLLLFFSGACALTYQVAWFRELRLVFGASTAASAAVLAVFMGGLGIGGAVLGKRADRSENPLLFYAHLEIGVAIVAALTPLLVRIAEKGYLALGGSSTLGTAGATVVRLLFSVAVLGPSTILMGGTLPAAAKAVERDSDIGRQRVAALYGVNTFGAVAGSLAASFLLLELFGTQLTQWIAALINILVGVVARGMSRSTSARVPAEDAPADAPAPSSPASVAWFPPAAAAIAGATFLLMELVWYRMLGPILGGSSYTFGLILAVALAGIAIGGLLYARMRPVPTFRLFALTCSLEAAFIALPYALGDRIAFLALLLRPLGKTSFGASVGVWAIVAVIVVLPAAIVSGFQFPVVIGLYGQGKTRVGRDVGNAYFANTAGSIVGSIAGGFGLIPALSAPGCWRLVVLVLAATAALALWVEGRVRAASEPRRASGLVAAGIGALALAGLLAEGPTALWRHTGIGAGRSDGVLGKVDASTVTSLDREARNLVVWEEDGRESSVALSHPVGFTFIVNGKADGHAIVDAPTQVMGGLLGAMLHEDPRRALVIGLGTGSTAGWLGRVPTMERVDVLELEPAILRVAKDCAPVNADVLANPKVHIRTADAREALLTSNERYDIIFSEPSNPYRAGVASLYTVEYYRAAAARLREHGMFLQWVQAYEVDAWAIATVATTLREAFPAVSTWQTMSGDLLFIAQAAPEPVDVERVRARLTTEPYATATRQVWHTTSAEGVLARHVGGPALTAFLVEKALGAVNHDDQNFLEFAFARSVGRHTRAVDQDLVDLARRLRADAPATKGAVDPNAMTIERWLYQKLEHLPMWPAPAELGALAPLGAAFEDIAAGRRATGLRTWKRLGRAPSAAYEAELLAHAAASTNDASFDALAALVADEAVRDLLRGLRLARGGTSTYAAAVDALERGFLRLRTDPWPSAEIIVEALQVAVQVAPFDADAARRLLAATSEPFAVDVQRHDRLSTQLRVSRHVSVPECIRALDRYVAIPWQRTILELRVLCTHAANHPSAPAAETDLARFLAAEGSYADLAPPPAPAAPRASPSASVPTPDEPKDEGPGDAGNADPPSAREQR